MADYWKSQGRKFCDFCKCWIADNKPSIDFHEGGKKHKENVCKRLKEIHKNSAKQAKQNKKFEDDLKKMENAGMAAYLKDVENNTRDMTADRIIKEKLNRTESQKMPQNANVMPAAAPETMPRYKQNNYRQFSQEIDPCDPMALTRLSHAKNQQSASFENKTQGKNKACKGKGKRKKAQEDDGRRKAVRKLWYEALSPEGYTYYWHIETNESVWEPPEEGYMTLAEQEEEVKEQALQEEFLQQLEKEDEIKKANLIEEQRANAERERMKELRKQREIKQQETNQQEIEPEEIKQEVQIKEEEGEEVVVNQESVKVEEKPYRRDYSIPEFQQPYGSWETVRVIERKPIDLQLPQQKQKNLPIFEKSEPVLPQRTFKEKTVTSILTKDSDEEDSLPSTFKKRKIGNKNVRKRLDDD
ncbi:PREDICTED: WW domain-binding protein 4 isoform X2 [Polistes dominula]|uniref:WW domain-binding protein 4 isoform X2 n=1 Tax=Polistes dominula TaxID=743375 RepID=A0ABM1HV37_POLDO|nr:PREDICTED: WW domain-binding protein 4 isoform X2 [Polistes dominula]